MTQTTFEQERAAIYEHFYSNYRLTPITWNNQEMNFVPNDQEAWVRLSIINGDALQGSIGTTKLFRYVGTVIVQVFTKTNTGIALSNQIVDEIDSIFKVLRLSTVNIQFRTPYRVDAGQNNGWQQVNVNCPFFRHSVETI